MRFSGSLDNVSYVLSGTKNLQQTSENINTFKNFKPISLKEIEILNKVSEILDEEIAIECTECRYCMDGVCPNNIPISEYFTLYNDVKRFGFRDFSTQGVQYRTFSLNDIYMVVHLIVMDVVNVLKYALKVLRFHYF